jgi:SAM-dependent methyltransferase
MPEALYDEIAAWYDASVRGGSLLTDLALHSLLELIGDVADQRVCDLACGQGLVARELARRGARVIGIDLSAKLLEIARRDEANEPLGISYQQDDAQALATIGGVQFDGVACNLALMDIPDLVACLRSVARVVRPGGWFVFSITHPCFQTPSSGWRSDDADGPGRIVRGYFAEGHWRSDNPDGVRGRVGAYHRTLGTYLNTLADAGFAPERLIEPRVTGVFAERLPGHHEVPALLAVRARRVRAAGDAV